MSKPWQIIEQTEAPTRFRYRVIDAACADELPPNIKVIQRDAFNAAALADAVQLLDGQVQVVQIQTPVDDELRRFSEMVVAQRTNHDKWRSENFSSRQCAEDMLALRMRLEAGKHAPSDSPLAQAWIKMQMEALSAVRECPLTSFADMEILRESVSYHDNIGVHTEGGAYRRGTYLSYAQGRHGTVFLDSRDHNSSNPNDPDYKELPRFWGGMPLQKVVFTDDAFHGGPTYGMIEEYSGLTQANHRNLIDAGVQQEGYFWREVQNLRIAVHEPG